MLKDKYTFEELLNIMSLLRSENGCPWDQEQTHESLKKYLIEETYEVLDAIDLNDQNKICEELGDLLLQIVFHSQIAKESENFCIQNVITGICKKMISRHTHVFGSEKADTPDEVIKNWDAIKNKEKKIATYTGLLKDIPSNFPALMRSYKIQQKAAQVGFEWEEIGEVFDKLYEEIDELKEAHREHDMDKITDEVGDVLFSVVNISRFLKVHPEMALTGTINKFINRFEYIERESINMGKSMERMTLGEMNELWEKAKVHIAGKIG